MPRVRPPLLLVISVVAFAALALAVGQGATQTFDAATVAAVRQLGLPRWGLEVARDVTALGSVTVLLLGVACVSGLLALHRQGALLALVWTATGGGFVASLLLKRFFDRPRPTVVEPLAFTVTKSFPSGHAMLSAVVFLTLGALVSELARTTATRRHGLVCACGLTLAVGLSRIVLGVHYPTDVLGGWLAGAAWASASAWATRGLKRTRPELLRGAG